MYPFFAQMFADDADDSIGDNVAAESRLAHRILDAYHAMMRGE
jgi:hypothetical protein